MPSGRHFDNIGGRLPDSGPLGYRIKAVLDESDLEIDIGEGYVDYSDLWREYLQEQGKMGASG